MQRGNPKSNFLREQKPSDRESNRRGILNLTRQSSIAEN